MVWHGNVGDRPGHAVERESCRRRARNRICFGAWCEHLHGNLIGVAKTLLLFHRVRGLFGTFVASLSSGKESPQTLRSMSQGF